MRRSPSPATLQRWRNSQRQGVPPLARGRALVASLPEPLRVSALRVTIPNATASSQTARSAWGPRLASAQWSSRAPRWTTPLSRYAPNPPLLVRCSRQYFISAPPRGSPQKKYRHDHRERGRPPFGLLSRIRNNAGATRRAGARPVHGA